MNDLLIIQDRSQEIAPHDFLSHVYKKSFLAFFFSFFAFYLLCFGITEAQFFDKNLHSARLEFLKQKGFEPRVVYDIGAYRGHWSEEIHKIYPRAQFFLFEANENNKPYLNALPFSFFIGVLGDRDGPVAFYTNDTTGDSIYLEQTKFYQEESCTRKMLPMTTLATIAQKNNIPPPDLIKIDVQGAEKLIIKGSPNLIRNAEVIILETKILEYNKQAPFAHETIALMEELGYVILDILECHYLPSGELNEIDFLFVKKNSKLIKTGLLIE